MCGVIGIFDKHLSGPEIEARLSGICASLQHRGPDDQGVWIDKNIPLGLGHRRLAILDLSQRGHQPMLSPSGRYAVSYNGEIYNFPDLRKELEGKSFSFQGGSDTEVLLAAIDAWGLLEAVKKMNGIFAFALWDLERRALHLVRDRLGVKPLCYGWFGGALVWGSDARIFRAHPGFKSEISPEALSLYFQYGFVPAPHMIYAGCFKVQPGTVVSIPLGGIERSQEETIYWSPVTATGTQSFQGTQSQATEELNNLLLDAVRRQMISDVSLGAFLSGGIDSSLVTALMQKSSAKPVKSFSIGFDEKAYDESGHAERVARHIGTEHTTFRVTPRDAMDVIPRMADIFDEPFADSSAIPTYLLSKLTRQHVTVSLSGDGGDELFGGYNRYRWASKIECLACVPKPFLRAAGALLSCTCLLPRLTSVRLQKALEFAQERGAPERYLRLLSLWSPDAIPVSGKAVRTTFNPARWESRLSPTENMMLTDAAFYLPDDVLCKVDRASMAVGLEARVPLLDHRVYEFAWSLPAAWKFDRTTGKKILREVLHRYVPKALVERPKMGFGVPVDSWLRGPLKAWAEELLSEKNLSESGLLDSALIRQRWSEHVSGRGQWQAQLWAVLMFLVWRNGNRPANR